MNKKTAKFIESLPKVENFNGAVNQFLIRGEDWTLFQSYNSPIVLKKNGQIYLFKNWDYSKTTGKYRNMLLMEDKESTLRRLKSGEYIAVDFEI